MPQLRSCLAIALAACASAPAPPACAQQKTGWVAASWVASWAASPSMQPAFQAAPPDLQPPASAVPEQTLREVVHLSLGGRAVRIRLSNAFGKEPLEVRNARIAVSSGGDATQGGGMPALFRRNAGIEIPAGADVLSDPVAMPVAGNRDLAISFETDGRSGTETVHVTALQTSYTAPGNQAGAASLRAARKIESWPFLTEVEVQPARPAGGAVAAFGDSITDGVHSTADRNRRWPDLLAARLRAAGIELAVANAGISGNRILHDGQGPVGPAFGLNALARMDRDVLALAGVRYLIVLLGINDIGQPGSGGVPADSAVTAAQIETGLAQIVSRAREHGIPVMGATLLPFKGTAYPGYYTAQKETIRESVNAWIRAPGNFDAVADFDRAVQDPSDPLRMRKEYASADWLHPNDAGMQALASSIPLTFFAR